MRQRSLSLWMVVWATVFALLVLSPARGECKGVEKTYLRSRGPENLRIEVCRKRRGGKPRCKHLETFAWPRVPMNRGVANSKKWAYVFYYPDMNKGVIRVRTYTLPKGKKLGDFRVFTHKGAAFLGPCGGLVNFRSSGSDSVALVIYSPKGKELWGASGEGGELSPSGQFLLTWPSNYVRRPGPDTLELYGLRSRKLLRKVTVTGGLAALDKIAWGTSKLVVRYKDAHGVKRRLSLRLPKQRCSSASR